MVLASPALTIQNHYQPYLALKTLIFHGCAVLSPPSFPASFPPCLPLLSRLLKNCEVDSLAGSRGCGVEGHSGRPGTTREKKKMSRKQRQSGDSATKQSVTLCAVVHPFHSSSPSPFPLSNWCPQSCVSPHLPALKLHQPYLLLSLSMIIIIIIVIIVVIMVRIAVIACYF